jgi:heme a synthase
MNTQQTLSNADPSTHRPWLHRFAVLLVVATFLLIFTGGTVTSHEAGLAVPDWPTTYGHNMFTVPWDLWLFKGGAFLEHSHRLKGSFVGTLTIIAAIWLWAASKDAPRRRWLRWLGLAALALVIFQGVLGGLRVTWYPTTPAGALTLAMVHGVTGQIYFCITVLIAAATSRWWCAADRSTAQPGDTSRAPEAGHPEPRTHTAARRLRIACVLLLATLLGQLVLGVLVRHTRSTLAIPDFPTSYGALIPPLDQQAIIDATDRMLPYELQPAAYATPAQVAMHFAHRAWAVAVLAAAAMAIVAAARFCNESLAASDGSLLRRPAIVLALLLAAQVMLGASIIWSAHMRGHPDIATAHQVVGAVTLAVAFLLTLRSWRLSPRPAARSATLPTSAIAMEVRPA